jgi:site-specific DNA recombinase
MSGSPTVNQADLPNGVRCAIYRRKSTEEGLEQEFNSLMAQREAAEAYILSQRELGWRVIPLLYDDGGFSGGSLERPALKRLLADVAGKLIDCVVVYKVDRLSRSLLDFASIIGILDKHNATFVSVTQAFNTATSLGRLTLNVLLSFAQFERELVQDRTRDKVHAARRKGKWTGGLPVLGYDIQGGKLAVNQEEANCVREIFHTFTQKQTLAETLYEMEQRGWKTKSWLTQKGTCFGGRRFNRSKLKFMLSNPLYLGKVRLKGALHDGEHPAIVDSDLWRQANELLKNRASGARNKNRSPMEGFLRGLLFCEACCSPMVPAYTKRNARKVRYYTCTSAQQHGWKTCPSRSLPASALEESVVSRLSSAASRTAPQSVQGIIERIGYDGRTRQVSILLRQGSVDDKTVYEASSRVRK